MAKLSFWRRQLKRVHPEGIPWPGSFFYNALSGTVIFQGHYEMVAKDILDYCAGESIRHRNRAWEAISETSSAVAEDAAGGDRFVAIYGSRGAEEYGQGGSIRRDRD